MLYVALRYSAMVTANRIVQVRCDKCRQEFHYELIRQGSGSARTSLFGDRDAARWRAMESASKKANRRIAYEADPVPCPKCQWVNQELVDGFRRTCYRSVPLIAAVFAILSAGLYFLLSLDRDSGTSGDLNILSSIAVGLGCGCAALIIRLWLRRMINPNRRFPHAPELPVGTPKAWTADEILGGGPQPAARATLTVAPGAFPGWIVFRVGRLVIPNICCECLGPPIKRYGQLLSRTEPSDQLPPSLCAECSSRLSIRWCAAAGLIVAVAALVAGIIYVGLGADLFVRATLAILFATFALTLGVAIVPNRLVKPYQVRAIDRNRGIFRIRFRSERFNALVRRASADSETASFLG